MKEFAQGPVTTLSLSPDASHLAAAVSPDTFSVTQISPPSNPLAPTPLPPATSDIPAPSLTSISFPSASTIYYASARGSFTRLSLTPKPTSQYTIPAAHSGDELTAIASLSPTSLIATAGKDGAIRCWDPETTQCTARLTGHRYETRAVALSAPPNASVTLVASAGRDKTVRLWDVRAGNASPIHVFQGHTSWVHDVALPNHNVPTLLSCAGDKTVRVWDIVAMRQRAVLTGHEYRVWGVDVSPDASFAVSCSTDATVRAWPMHEGHVGEAHVFEGHRDSVLSVAVASHAGLVVSGCEDGSVFVWDCNGLFGRTRSVPQLIDLGDTRPTPVQEPSAIPPQLDTDPLVMEVPSPTPDQISAIVVEQTPLKVTPDSPIFPKTAPPVITSHSPILAKAAGHVITPNSPIATKKAPLFVTPKSPMSSGVASPILNETDQLRAAIAMGTERSQRFDKSAAELVRALTRVQDLEKAVGEADARVKGRDAEIARLRAQVVARDSEVGALRAELLATKALVQAGEVHQLLVDNPRKADVCLDYEEPVNKIGAVSDQLSALAARLDAMIATN